jgi:hypothetical protein
MALFFESTVTQKVLDTAVCRFRRNLGSPGCDPKLERNGLIVEFIVLTIVETTLLPSLRPEMQVPLGSKSADWGRQQNKEVPRNHRFSS